MSNPLRPSRCHRAGRAIRLALSLVVTMALSACHLSRQWYAEYQSISHWTASDRLKFGIDSVAEGGTYDTRLTIRATASQPYPYRQLMVEVEQRWRVGNGRTKTYTDTLVCNITDTEGQRTTEGGVSLYAYEFDIRRLALPQGAHGDITVRHLMSQYELEGFSDIGILTVKR